ncbi:hypothetical protein NPIL_501471 [Nephila pilipes]|uniref:Uncharacterized protein n=1 Tax=Nephila pilipes TaxID=299642 RepID=A0A8X6QUP1_NEPPI|nr:hypothetical protein NPIL_501471 [Nephila pilipes]
MRNKVHDVTQHTSSPVISLVESCIALQLVKEIAISQTEISLRHQILKRFKFFGSLLNLPITIRDRPRHQELEIVIVLSSDYFTSPSLTKKERPHKNPASSFSFLL